MRAEVSIGGASSVPFKHQLGRLLTITTAGLIASTIAGAAYDKFIHGKTDDIIEVN